MKRPFPGDELRIKTRGAFTNFFSECEGVEPNFGPESSNDRPSVADNSTNSGRGD